MRTSGGRGAEGWIMAIPMLALIIAGSMASGGVDAALITIEGTIREALTTIVNFVRSF
jgi:hypothetical protein